MKSVSFKFGLIPGVFFIAWKMFVFYTHQQFSPMGIFSSIAALVVLFICVFLGIKKTRDKEYDGYIILKSCMKAGIKTTLVSATIIALFTYAYLQFIDTGYATDYIARIVKNAVNSKAEFKDINAEIEKFKAIHTPFKESTFALFFTLLAGSFMSFICSSFLVKTKEEV